ncbi:DUF4350 domain-containing protein [Streptomyces litchfieldiae]|uniref:DUF4350 domain-containing protein n=1 Tax=Streptomyces litchfieldiae TaxID=3075543 RepID=A0ABU2MNX7_9ACTN|nr:DUF4350 domain-containing protein [Streptomyces sp. DSM 44938]MDT0343048.1 DUF4350 domain-containing protein [Streptomyces sp. DSM 44938]
MTGDTAVSPDARALWRRGRGFLAAFAVLVVTGLLIALLTSGDSGTLNPRSATQTGSRAIAELLARHGVDTTPVTTAREAAAATGPDTTLLVTDSEDLTDSSRATLREAVADSGARTVLVAPGQRALDAFAPGVTTAAPAPVEERAPACASDIAEHAGSARMGGTRYDLSGLPPTGVTACYPVAGLPTLATVPTASPGGETVLPTLATVPTASPGGETVLLGAPDLLYNQHLDEDGNASLALQLLGDRAHVVWYLPSPAEAPASGEEESLTGLLDPGWRWATLQLGIAAGLAALWRARRLGPVVAERLPVSVRATETTEGHARLYHQAGARDRAADALRAATRDRLAPLVGLAPAAAHTPEALPTALAAHTGESPQAVHALLFGPPPADDHALVRLADDLDALERRVTPHTTSEGKDPRS